MIPRQPSEQDLRGILIINGARFDKLLLKSYDNFGLWQAPRTQKAANSYTMNRLY